MSRRAFRAPPYPFSSFLNPYRWACPCISILQLASVSKHIHIQMQTFMPKPDLPMHRWAHFDACHVCMSKMLIYMCHLRYT